MSRHSRNKPRRQHWVPRCYLRYFATPESKNSEEPAVWIFSKHEGDPRLTGISQIAAQNYLYSPRCEDGTRNWDMESKLASLEGLAAQIWPMVADGFLDLHRQVSVRRAVALFIAILHLRHPRMRAEITRIHTQLVGLCETFPKDENGNPQIAEIEYRGIHIPFDASEWHQYKSAGCDQKHRMFVDSLNQHAIWCAQVLLKKRWSIVFADRPLFITSDTPVAVNNCTRSTFGLDTPGTLVSVPLSPTRVLMMDDRHDQPECKYYPLAGDDPAPFNFIAWRNCERFMVSPRPTDTVCAEMLSSAEQLPDRG